MPADYNFTDERNKVGKKKKEKEDVCLAILCGLGGKIYVFRMPSPIEMWSKVKVMEQELARQEGKSWLWKKLNDTGPGNKHTSKSVVRIHLMQIGGPAANARAQTESFDQ